MRSVRLVLRNHKCSATAEPNVPPPMMMKSNGRMSPRGGRAFPFTSRALAR